MRWYIRAAVLPVCFFALIAPVTGQQQRVDPRNMYERIAAIVPLQGSGSFEDPVRPLYTPLPSALRAAAASRTRAGILGFTYVLSDDGKHALVEFVAKDRAAFQQIMADPSVRSFLKGRDKREDIEAEFKKYKKDFDFTHFWVRVP